MSTDLTFTDDGVDVVYDGTEFELDKDLIEEATGEAFTADYFLEYANSKFGELYGV